MLVFFFSYSSKIPFSVTLHLYSVAFRGDDEEQQGVIDKDHFHQTEEAEVRNKCVSML